MITNTNISGTSATSIIPIGSANEGTLSLISIANTHTVGFLVDVYIYNSSNSYYMIKGVELPKGTTLLLDGESVVYNSKLYALYIKLAAAASGTSSVSVRTKTKKL